MNEFNNREYSVRKSFLEYRHIDLHFIYSFCWDSEAPIRSEVFSHEAFRDDGWVAALLHERVIGGLGADTQEAAWIGAYQPSFVVPRRYLDRSAREGEGGPAWLVVPMQAEANLTIAELNIEVGSFNAEDFLSFDRPVVAYPVCLGWTIRLFDTGSGTFTYRVCARDLDRISDRGRRFSLVHWLLRLAPNIDSMPEGHGIVMREAPLTDSFLFRRETGTVRLYDLMQTHLRRALGKAPASLWKVGQQPVEPRIRVRPFCRERDNPVGEPPEEPRRFSKYSCDWQDGQSPFILTTIVLSPDSMDFLVMPRDNTAKEIASIYTKLTLDNRRIEQDYLRITEDYLREALQYGDAGKRLLNLCLDERVFFALSRRGAIALTADPNDIPALFVIPSLLNLLEILRARLYAAIDVGFRISQYARQLACSDPGTTSTADVLNYVKLRETVLLNIQNPLQYLFDGGSVTELALKAEDLLFVNASWDNVRRSFDMLDRLITAWETERFRIRLRS